MGDNADDQGLIEEPENITVNDDADKKDVEVDAEPKVESYFYYKRKAEKAARQATPTKQADEEETDHPTGSYVTREEMEQMMQGYGQTTRERDVDHYLTQHPELAPFRAKAEKWWNHESRRHLPFETVILEAAGPNELLRIGAKLAQENMKKAEQTVTGGGGTVRPNVSGKFTKDQIMKMSPTEFKKNFNL